MAGSDDLLKQYMEVVENHHGIDLNRATARGRFLFGHVP
jgi:hypothetical protein